MITARTHWRDLLYLSGDLVDAMRAGKSFAEASEEFPFGKLGDIMEGSPDLMIGMDVYPSNGEINFTNTGCEVAFPDNPEKTYTRFLPRLRGQEDDGEALHDTCNKIDWSGFEDAYDTLKEEWSYAD